MDPHKFVPAILVVVGIVFALALLAAFVVRPLAVRAAALMPLGQMAAFLTGFGMLFKFPRTPTPEFWTTPVFAAVISGLCGMLTVLIRPQWFAWLMRLLAVGGIMYVVFVAKWSGYWHYALWVALGQCVLLIALEPLARLREPATAPAASTAFMLSAAALSFIALPFVDQSIGQIAALLSALMGPVMVLGFFPRTAPLARAGTTFPALMLPVLCAIVAFYNPDIKPPSPAFYFWIAAAPLVAALAWLPALRKRKWLCFALVFAGSVVVLAPTILIAVKYAAPLDQPDSNEGMAN